MSIRELKCINRLPTPTFFRDSVGSFRSNLMLNDVYEGDGFQYFTNTSFELIPNLDYAIFTCQTHVQTIAFFILSCIKNQVLSRQSKVVHFKI